jgi:hypothetical protein
MREWCLRSLHPDGPSRSQPYRNRPERRRVLTRRSDWPRSTGSLRGLRALLMSTGSRGRPQPGGSRVNRGGAARRDPKGTTSVFGPRRCHTGAVPCRHSGRLPTDHCAAEPRTECGDAVARSVPAEVLAITGALQAGSRDHRRAEMPSAVVRAGRSCDLRCQSTRGEDNDPANGGQSPRSARAKRGPRGRRKRHASACR